MINGIGPANRARIESAREGVAAKVAPAATQNIKDDTLSTGERSLVAALAKAGPPIDSEKIAAIRAAIAQGRYPIDASVIAGKMLELDLPGGN